MLVTAGVVWRTQQIADTAQASSHREATHHEQQINTNRRFSMENRQLIRALHADLFCIEDWAAHLVGDLRQQIGPKANRRIENLFEAFRVALKGEVPKATRLARKSIREDEQYLRNLKAHPIPLPKLRCRLVIPQPRPSPTHPNGPSPSPGTVTRTVTVPGPTRTVVIVEPPGKARHRHQHRR